MLRPHGLQRVVSLGGLAAQHDAVGSVQHGVGHVAALGAGGAGLLDHALQHLRVETVPRRRTVREGDTFEKWKREPRSGARSPCGRLHTGGDLALGRDK